MEKNDVFWYGITFKAGIPAFEKIKEFIMHNGALIYVKRVPNRSFLEIVEKKVEKEEYENDNMFSEYL